jgi:hypothetical protein
MKIEQRSWSQANGWTQIRNCDFNTDKCNLVIAFGSRELLSNSSKFDEIKKRYPNANILINTTSGEIIDVQVNDETLSLTAIEFEKTIISTSDLEIASFVDSFEAGRKLASNFKSEGLVNVLVIADGQKVNGSDLVRGIQSNINKDVVITGGLAGDGSKFEKTLVGLNNTPEEGKIVAIGFYGKHIMVSHGSMGGWDAFGPERLVTKATTNVLYELDGQPALDIYKNYLGEFSKDLPGSGLLFPLSVRLNNDPNPVVRTILGINEADKSLTFAGNIPVGSYARLMKANFERLIEGASDAATNSKEKVENPDLAILISCVGRKLVLNQRIEEEVEVIRETFGSSTALTGFYSYGEIAPNSGFNQCELHNQTMTITTLTEI